MNKIMTGFVCFFLLLNVFPLIGSITENLNNAPIYDKSNTGWASQIEDAVVSSQPKLTKHGNYCSIALEEATTYTHNAGQPIMPVITKTYSFPIGTIISQVSCISGMMNKMSIEKDIKYTAHPVTCGSNIIPIEQERDGSIYGSSDFYPPKWYDYYIGVGLNGTKRVTYLTLKFYPVRYAPQLHTIQYVQQADIRIQLQPPRHPVVLNDVYDLLLIAPQRFESDLQRLVDHKETVGIKTKLMTTEDIYDIYAGRDKQEQIKYCIKHAIEEWNITYVLLFGGMRGQRFWSWHIPVRYSHVSPITIFGPKTKYISDLYYADIYRYDAETGFSFDDWDDDGDDIFSEWTSFSNKDVMDLYPDVYIGRIPCRYSRDVTKVVDRIIRYETTSYGAEWFNRIAVVGGDTFIDSDWGYDTDYDEGKEMTAYVLNFMPDFEHIRLWTDGDGDIEYTPKNTINVLNQGQGFYLFSGHGTTTSFSTHPHGDDSISIRLDVSDLKNLNNNDKLPIYVLSNCDNCQFNVSILNFLQGFKNGFSYPFLFAETVPYCLGWFVSYLETGGAIASLGITTYGLSDIGDDNNNGICNIVEYYDGWIHAHYFEVYNQSVNILGQVFGQTITGYLNQFPINWNGMSNSQSHYDVTIAQYNVLIGDPSLRIGGYP